MTVKNKNKCCILPDEGGRYTPETRWACSPIYLYVLELSADALLHVFILINVIMLILYVQDRKNYFTLARIHNRVAQSHIEPLPPLFFSLISSI